MTYNLQMDVVLTREALIDALRLELRRALWEAKIELHRNTIKAIARRVAQQAVPESSRLGK